MFKDPMQGGPFAARGRTVGRAKARSAVPTISKILRLKNGRHCAAVCAWRVASRRTHLFPPYDGLKRHPGLIIAPVSALVDVLVLLFGPPIRARSSPPPPPA